MTLAVPEPTLPSDVRTDRVGALAAWFRLVAGMFDRSPLEAAISISAETADVITFTVQVQDRRARTAIGPFVVDLWVSNAADGTPGGTQTVTVNQGVVMDTIAADEQFVVLTTPAGLIEIDVEVSGSGSRTVYAGVRPALQSKGAVWV